jgi:hypothetical protein
MGTEVFFRGLTIFAIATGGSLIAIVEEVQGATPNPAAVEVRYRVKLAAVSEKISAPPGAGASPRKLARTRLPHS